MAWYKRRVVRIFPSVFVCALAASAIDMEGRISVLRLFGGEFIIAIMIYYVMLWCVRRFLADTIRGIVEIENAGTQHQFIFGLYALGFRTHIGILGRVEICGCGPAEIIFLAHGSKSLCFACPTVSTDSM